MGIYVRAAAGALMSLILGGVGSAAEQAVSDSDIVVGVWQPHKVRVSYFGITSQFTCSGLEDHVRQILVHLGARKDAKVRAVGCPGGPDRPSPTAWIDAEFSTLALAGDPRSSDAVNAYWAARELGPRRPFFMGDGDCELVDQLQKTIQESFTLRDLEYRTDCVPHQISLNGFSVKAQTLVPMPDTASAMGKPRG